MSGGRIREATRPRRDGDRSPEALRERARTLLRETVADAGADGVVVALSGGVDSATTAALAADALGAEAVTTLHMPTAVTEEANTADAREFAESLGVDHGTLRLEPAIETFKRHVAPRIAPAGDARAAGNLASRLRMACAYFVANAENRLVVGTSNRTERLLGYVTKYGDAAADVFPLGAYDKGEVRALAEHLGVPAAIVGKPPTAGFREGQTDEADLGAPYPTLDRVLRTLVDGAESEPDGVAGAPGVPDVSDVDTGTVERLAARVVGSTHKRSPPPSPPRAGGEPGALSRDVVDDADAGSRAAPLERFLRGYVDAADAGGAIVAMDGGVSSGVAAALAARALGPERVRGLFLPSHLAAEYDTPDPGRLATDLGIDYDRVNVRPLVAELRSQLPGTLVRDAGSRELGNLAARVRTACVYYVANTTDRLVVGSTDRTEAMLGYVTKYGDGAADLRPLGGRYRTELRALGRELGLPKSVVDRPSTAGFRIGTTEADELGADFAAIDEVLVRLVDRDAGIERTATEVALPEETVRRFARAHVDSRHKRAMPPTTATGAAEPEHFHELELKFS